MVRKKQTSLKSQWKAKRKKVLAKMGALLLLCTFCGSLTGCYDRREIDDLAYVVAIGLDKGKSNMLKMTLQFAVPTALGGGQEGGSGSGGSNASTVTTVETPTLYSGLNMVNNCVSKQVNLSHAKVIVFSKELAKEGIHQYIHAIIRGREFRPNMFVLVSRDSAEEYIRSVKPSLEVNPAKYYEMNLEAFRYTAFTGNTTLINFYLQEECTCSQAVATLAAVNKYKSTADFNVQHSTARRKDRSYPLEGDFKAGNIPRVGEVEAEIMGIAVFDGGTMIGELDGEETMYYLMQTGQFHYSYFTIPDPIVKNKFVVLNVSQSRKPIHKVRIEEEHPRIYAKNRLEADILSIQSGKNYEDTKNVGILEKAAEDFIKKSMLRFLNRTTTELNADVCAFGKIMKGKFLTWKEWQDFKWLERYKDATFELDVDLKIRRPGLIIRSKPAYSTKGDEMH